MGYSTTYRAYTSVFFQLTATSQSYTITAPPISGWNFPDDVATRQTARTTEQASQATCTGSSPRPTVQTSEALGSSSMPPGIVAGLIVASVWALAATLAALVTGMLLLRAHRRRHNAAEDASEKAPDGEGKQGHVEDQGGGTSGVDDSTANIASLHIPFSVPGSSRHELASTTPRELEGNTPALSPVWDTNLAML